MDIEYKVIFDMSARVWRQRITMLIFYFPPADVEVHASLLSSDGSVSQAESSIAGTTFASLLCARCRVQNACFGDKNSLMGAAFQIKGAQTPRQC